MKRFRVIDATYAQALEDSLNALYLDGYIFLAASRGLVILENVQISERDMDFGQQPT